MLKIAVCDDSPLFLELAIKFINKWSEERQFPVSISSYNNGDDLLAANAEERMDIIFLDIIMPLLMAWIPQENFVRRIKLLRSFS